MNAIDLTNEIATWIAAKDFGPMSNQLRCAAMCAIDDGFTQAEFVSACVANGVNKGSARNRWNEV